MYEAHLNHFQNKKLSVGQPKSVAKFPIAWIPIELAGFRQQKLAGQL